MKRTLLFTTAFSVNLCVAAGADLRFVGEHLSAVSADGRYVVGTQDGRGFRYAVETGTYDTLPFDPTAINGDGSVVVGLNPTDQRIARWSGTTTLLDALPYPSQAALIASRADIIAGNAWESETPHAFTWTDGTLTEIPLPAVGPTWLRGMTASGAVIGNVYEETSTIPFIFQDGVTTDLRTKFDLLDIQTISDDGSAVSGFNLDAFRSVIINSNGLHLLDSVAAPGFVPYALNEDGTRAGGTWEPSLEFTLAAVWSEKAGAIPLSDLVDLPPLWRLDDVVDISGDGRVVIGNAYGGPDFESKGYIVSHLDSFHPIPEPSTYGTAALVLLGAVLVVRRRRGSSANAARSNDGLER